MLLLNTVGRFVFSTPYTPSGKAHGEVDEQYMMKTILTSDESFPYVKRRSKVIKAEKVCFHDYGLLKHKQTPSPPDQFNST